RHQAGLVLVSLNQAGAQIVEFTLQPIDFRLQPIALRLAGAARADPGTSHCKQQAQQQPRPNARKRCADSLAGQPLIHLSGSRRQHGEMIHQVLAWEDMTDFGISGAVLTDCQMLSSASMSSARMPSWPPAISSTARNRDSNF